MGRAPIPEHLRLLKNDKAHAHRYVTKDGFEGIDMNNVRPPSNMGEAAKKIFMETFNKLDENYQLSVLDIDLLVLYSNNQEQLEAVELILRQEGLCYETSFGVKERPEVKIHNNCKMLSMKLIQEFKKFPRKTKSAAENPFAKFGAASG